MPSMRAAQLRYDESSPEPALDDRRVLWLHDQLDSLREELEDATQHAKDLRERIEDVEEELRSV